MFYGYINYSGKYYYFTGGEYDSNIALRKNYKSISALGEALKRHGFKDLPKNTKIHYAKIAPKKKAVKSVKKGRSKNPAKSVRAKLKEATRRFEDFTGHKPEYIDTHHLKDFKQGFKIGQCDGILYTTVRDGRTEKYIHEFKNSSRPILASSYDGKTIALIGGKYSFTERGIVDKS